MRPPMLSPALLLHLSLPCRYPCRPCPVCPFLWRRRLQARFRSSRGAARVPDRSVERFVMRRVQIALPLAQSVQSLCAVLPLLLQYEWLARATLRLLRCRLRLLALLPRPRHARWWSFPRRVSRCARW